MLACLANSGKTESSLCTPAVTLAQVKINVTAERKVFILVKDKKGGGDLLEFLHR